jgi:hypothetical protein
MKNSESISALGAIPDPIYGVLATEVPAAPCRSAVKILLSNGNIAENAAL